ncbi:MAG: N-acetyltransferase [Gemmatimonadaceae bacterium]|nr:N-acetyltransferase [Gemmatimonadaceae bacterium]
MSDIQIVKQVEGSRGRYVATVSGHEGEAELVFTVRSPQLISADHTGSPDTLRGTGAAAALVRYLIDDARANGFRIIPRCPYVRAQYQRHPEWQDVMTLPPGHTPDDA